MARTAQIKTITYMALMAALNVLFALLASVVPLAGLFLSIALPFASALVALKTDARFYPIYAIATLGLSLVVALGNIETTIFYVLPALVMGLFFGSMLKLRWPILAILVLASYVQLALLYWTIGMINVIFMIDFIASLQTLLRAPSAIMPLFLHAIALAQTSFTYFIIGNELRKLGERQLPSKTGNLAMCWAFLLASAACLAIGMFHPLGYILLAPTLVGAGATIHDWITRRRFGWLIALGPLIILSVFATAVLFPLVPSPAAPLLVAIFPFVANLLHLLQLYLPRGKRSHKINSRGIA